MFPRPEVHLFVLWSEARYEERRILDDIAARFTVLATAEVCWTGGETFARSLTRMYGEALPPDSDKERHCGTGPFLAVVVDDRRPRYRVRRTRRGLRLLNAGVFDARERYRGWTGGGYRVHASDSVAEAERNLVLMSGRRGADFRTAPAPAAVRHRWGDPVGTGGWAGLDELVLALRAYGAEPAHPPSGGGLTVHASDAWWAEHVAGGPEQAPGVREVTVGGRPLRLTVLDRPRPRSWGRIIASARWLVRLPAG